MIKTSLGTVEFRGPDIIIHADMSAVLLAFVKTYGIDALTKIVKIALMPEEEIDERVRGLEMPEDLKALIKEAEEDDMD